MLKLFAVRVHIFMSLSETHKALSFPSIFQLEPVKSGARQTFRWPNNWVKCVSALAVVYWVCWDKWPQWTLHLPLLKTSYSCNYKLQIIILGEAQDPLFQSIRKEWYEQRGYFLHQCNVLRLYKGWLWHTVVDDLSIRLCDVTCKN